LSPWTYPIALALISVLVAGAEWLVPWRREQTKLRAWLWSDVLYLVFNGHFLGVLVWVIATTYVVPWFDAVLVGIGIRGWVYFGAASGWPLWLQIVAVLFVTDFLHWCVHNLLHRVPFLWELHKAHHSVRDGEMDWIVSFRFQWTEVVVYKTLQYLPLVWFGFGAEAVMVHAVFGTLIGHLNHANLNLSYGPLRYLLNSPRMHIWHHDFDGGAKSTVNFGVIFSCWDWIFGTAHMPDEPPARIGFPGVEMFPRSFFGQAAWPLQRFVRGRRGRWAGVAVGAVSLAAALAWLYA
jgi:sterol desaturase/sphingolipid hydroxylase (fatty acid hydroxylase superfamily)